MRSNTTLHYNNLPQAISVIKSAKVSSAGSTLKGNSIQVRVKFTNTMGQPSIGYFSINSSRISDYKFYDPGFMRKCFRMSAIGSAARSQYDDWIKGDPVELRRLQKEILDAAKKEYSEGEATRRKNEAAVAKCRKALSEWMIHSFKHGIDQEEVLQIMRESLIKSTMSE